MGHKLTKHADGSPGCCEGPDEVGDEEAWIHMGSSPVTEFSSRAHAAGGELRGRREACFPNLLTL